jgi:hypothetical protein
VIFYQGSVLANLLPVEVVTKTVSLALITRILRTRKEEEEKRSKRKSSKEHKSLSLVTNLFGVILNLGEDLISLFVPWNEV